MKTISTEDEYREALKRFLEICKSSQDLQEANDLEQMMYLLEMYERENCP